MPCMEPVTAILPCEPCTEIEWFYACYHVAQNSSMQNHVGNSIKQLSGTLCSGACNRMQFHDVLNVGKYSPVIKEWNPCLVIKFGTPNDFVNFSKTVKFSKV